MPDHTKKLDVLMPAIREQLQNGGTVRFAPKGTSMRPMLRQGLDTVVLSPLPEQLKPYDLPLYQRENGQYVLHRIVAVRDGAYTCIGDNQFEYEYGVTHDQMIGLVTAYYREDKLCKVSGLRYWIYCRYWHNSRRVRWHYLRFRKKLSDVKNRLLHRKETAGEERS